MNNKIIIGLLAAALILGGYGALRPETVKQVVQNLGSAGPDMFSYLTVHGVFTQGGGVRATSTVNTAETLLGTDFDDENVIDYTANGAVAGVTLTLPASTTFPLSPDIGSVRTIFIRNATTTAATTITIAGNTGVLLKVASSTAIGAAGSLANGVPVIAGDTDGGNHAKLFFLRKANSDIEVFMQSFRD